jgi:hypothetical protein
MTRFSSSQDPLDIFQVIRDSVDFADLVQRETGTKLDDKGRGLCPLVRQSSGNPAFTVYEDGRAHCFSCGFHGDVIGFWSTLKGFDSQFQAARDLARRERIDLPTDDPESLRRASERRQREERALERADRNHRRLEEDTSRAGRAREYLDGRGFDEELRRRFLLGLSSDGSISIPFWNSGRIHGIIRRTSGSSKYLAPKTEEMPLGRKPLMMKDPLRDEVVFLVEGFLDHLALSACGVPSVGIGCATPSASQIKDLRNLIRRGHEIVVVPDNDKNGRGIEAARKTVEKLYPGARMAGFLPEPQKDAADLFESASREEVRETLWDLAEEARDAVGLALEDLPEDDLRRVRHIKSRILPLILRLPDSEREAVLRGVGKAAGLPLNVMRQAMVEVQEPGESGESGESEEEIPESEWADLLDGGVLGRYASDAARTRGVVGDRGVLKLLTLSAISAQLSRRLDNRPTGVSLMLSGEASRGKNFLTDAATSLLPDEWVIAFEVASSQAFYYAVEDDPEFLKHKFLYPNEAEAVDQVVEFLRPMLSKGSAKKLVTNKDKSGRNTWEELEVEGPITGVIPTVRNKLDDQLQTRLLMVGLEEVEDRIRLHTRSVSKAYSPNWIDEFDETLRSRWRSALRSLQGVRLVAIPFGDDDRFCVTNEGLSHGARVWTSLIGVMCAHAWLEQRNREIRTLRGGERAIIATSADYRAAYNLFKDTSKRTVIPLSDRQRDIVQAVYDLSLFSHFSDDGFSTRRIAQKVEDTTGRKMSPGTVSKNRSYLTMSVGVLRLTDDNKLAIDSDLTPADWEGGDPMAGFPRPGEVARWGREKAGYSSFQGNKETPNGKADTYKEKPVSWVGNTEETQETPHTYAENARGNGGPTDAQQAIYWRLREENPEMSSEEALKRAREEAPS